MALPWGLGWRKLSHTWALVARTWLWRQVARVGPKEAKKLLEVMGNHPVLEVNHATLLALSVRPAWLCGCTGKPVREPVGGGGLLCGGQTVSKVLVMFFNGCEAAALGMSWLRTVLGPPHGNAGEPRDFQLESR